MKIEDILKKVLNFKIDDLKDRKSRVWQKVHASIQADLQNNIENNLVAEPRVSQRHGLGLVPLGVALLLVVMGVSTVTAFNNSLPGDRFYALKQAVEEAQLKLALNEESKQDLQIVLLEKRAKEVAAIESKVKRGEKITEKQQEAVEELKHEVGKTVMSLLESSEQDEVTIEGEKKSKEDEDDKEELGEVATMLDEEEKSEASEELEEDVPEDDVDVKVGEQIEKISIAETRIVGEAVVKFLQSTKLTGEQKTKKILEVAKMAAEKQDLDENSIDNEIQKEARDSDTSEEGEVESNDQNSLDEQSGEDNSVIKGEVESNVQIKELE